MNRRWVFRLGFWHILLLRQYRTRYGWSHGRRFYSVRLRWQWSFGRCRAAQPPQHAFDLGPLRFFWSY